MVLIDGCTATVAADTVAVVASADVGTAVATATGGRVVGGPPATDVVDPAVTTEVATETVDRTTIGNAVDDAQPANSTVAIAKAAPEATRRETLVISCPPEIATMHRHHNTPGSVGTLAAQIDTAGLAPVAITRPS